MKRIEELLQQRAKAVKDLRDIADAADAEKRNLTAEDRTKIDAVEAEIAALESRIEFEKKQDEREKSLRGHSISPAGAGARSAPQAGAMSKNVRSAPEYREAFNHYLLTGEKRDLIQTEDPSGGYLVADEQFSSELISNLTDKVTMRRISRVRPPIKGVKSIGNPTLAARMSSAAWGSEVSSPSYDAALKFGKRKMMPSIMTAGIKVSRTLLYNASMDPGSIVREEMARDCGELEEKAFLSGHGAEQALGVFTASDDGIGTAQDVVTGLATGLTADGLINFVDTLKDGYLPNAKWLVHRSFKTRCRLLKDGQGNYIWRAGLERKEPDMLLGYEIVTADNVPHTFTNGLYVAVFGDFSWYWIVDSDQVEVQRLVELYAESNLDAFITRRYTDGAPVKAEAFVRLKCGV